MLYKIAVYFLKNRERRDVLLVTAVVLGLGVFLGFGNLLNQVIPESSGVLSQFKKVFICGTSFAVAMSVAVSSLLKMSRFLNKIQTNYIIR